LYIYVIIFCSAFVYMYVICHGNIGGFVIVSTALHVVMLFD